MLWACSGHCHRTEQRRSPAMHCPQQPFRRSTAATCPRPSILHTAPPLLPSPMPHRLQTRSERAQDAAANRCAHQWMTQRRCCTFQLHRWLRRTCRTRVCQGHAQHNVLQRRRHQTNHAGRLRRFCLLSATCRGLAVRRLVHDWASCVRDQ